ncbi:MAG: hypothetical protein K2X62_06205 [Beijerinckiaceae bacterium]|jgi:CheY-like chemotaxis protein|nr:hypothetical protein [Beijerinckiaceae bacterium]
MGRLACQPFAIVSDPDAARRWTATEIVKQLGYIVHPAQSPGEALEILLQLGSNHPLMRGARPLLVMAMDDEPEIARALAALARTFCSGIRVIIATDRPIGSTAVVDAEVQRDFAGAELRDAVRELCSATASFKPSLTTRASHLGERTHSS